MNRTSYACRVGKIRADGATYFLRTELEPRRAGPGIALYCIYKDMWLNREDATSRSFGSRAKYT